MAVLLGWHRSATSATMLPANAVVLQIHARAPGPRGRQRMSASPDLAQAASVSTRMLAARPARFTSALPFTPGRTSAR